MNEKGFMFPVTLCILLLFTIFLSVQLNQYVIEKRSLIEIEHFERNQYYFLQSLQQVEKQLQEGSSETLGSFTYEKGLVTYSITSGGSNLLQITLRSKFDTTEEAMGIGYYNKELKKLTKWLERN
ncbi:competence type IV pilus minor pilin ComGG [Robertmurraya kyonggiensis]|nr:competence type IV pilus minor pilin ComGG [Robertmurraya kyonggiensis]